MRVTLLFIILFTAATASAFSVRYLKNYTTSDGLSQSQALAVAQDDKGFVWVGTRSGGINRLDGTSIRNREYNRFIKDTKINDVVSFQGKIWLATGTGVYSISDDGSVAQINKETGSYLDLSVSGGRLLALKYTRGKNTVSFLKDNSFEELPSIIPQEAEPFKFAVSRNGEIWVATLNHGVFYINKGVSAQVGGTENFSMADIALFDESRVVAGSTIKGVYILKGGAVESTVLENNDMVSAIFVDADQSIYIGTEKNGFYIKYKDTRLEHYSNDAGLPASAIKSFFHDNIGNLWLSLDGKGVVVLPPIVFVNFTEKDKIEGPFVFEEPEKDKILIGGNSGFSYYEKDINRLTRLADDCAGKDNICSLNIPYAMARTGNKFLIGTKDGLYESNSKYPFNDLKKIEFPEQSPGIPVSVYRIMKYRDGKWLIYTKLGLFIFDDGRVEPFDVKGLCGIPEDRFKDVTVDADSSLFLLTMNNSFIICDSGKRKKEQIPKEISQYEKFISKLYADNSGSVWIGTKQKIIRYDRKADKAVIVDDPENNVFDFVYFIYTTKEKKTFVGTNRGIYLIENDRLIYNYNLNDGLVKEETNTNAAFEDANGDMWFGIEDSAVWMRKDMEMKRKSIAPQIFMESLKIYDNKADISTDRLTLNFNQNHLTFGYISPSAANPALVSYRYILRGLEHDWTRIEHNNIMFPHIPPGDYVFEVKAVNRFGAESPSTAMLSVTILPPFWETWWFRTAMILSAFLLIIFYINLATRKVKLKSAYLEKVVSERTDQLKIEIEKSHQHLKKIEELKEKFEMLSTIDELTGLYNRRFFFQRLEDELSRINRAGICLGILIIDVDHFKETNDTYGHISGDVVLKRLADLLLENKRKNDILSRYGGEEFIVACEVKNSSDLEIIAERMRMAVDAAEFHLPGGEVLRKTISIGGAIYNIDSNDMDESIKLADSMLYKAKNTGRNRTVLYS